MPRVHVLSSAVSLAWSVSCPQWAVCVAHTRRFCANCAFVFSSLCGHTLRTDLSLSLRHHRSVLKTSPLCRALYRSYVPLGTALEFGGGPGRKAFELEQKFEWVQGADYSQVFADAANQLCRDGSLDGVVRDQFGIDATPRQRVTFDQVLRTARFPARLRLGVWFQPHRPSA